jgi:glycosyltransferase involved in cell wall biosynthesis
MKILMIAPQPYFEPRGTPISVYQRLVGLSKLGYEIDLVTYHLGEDVKISGVTIYRALPVSQIKSIKVGPSWEKIPLDILLFMKCVGLLIKNKYDVIHSHEEAGFFSLLLAWLFRKIHVYDMHSSLPKQLVNFKFWDNRLMVSLFVHLEKLVINTCDAMITIGPDLEKYVQKINPGVPHQMIENLPLGNEESEGINEREIRKDLGFKDKFIIVYTGTFERYQGVDLLIKGLGRVLPEYPETELILVGGRPEQIEAYKRLVEQHLMVNSVRFTGTVSIEEADKYIQIADVLVSPRIEGTSVPLKVYTYLRAGKPIMATNIPAHTLVLDGTIAELVTPTEDAFAEGLIKLIGDGELRATLGARSRQLALEKYSETNYLTKLEKLYSGLKPPSRPQTEQASATEN